MAAAVGAKRKRDMEFGDLPFGIRTLTKNFIQGGVDDWKLKFNKCLLELKQTISLDRIRFNLLLRRGISNSGMMSFIILNRTSNVLDLYKAANREFRPYSINQIIKMEANDEEPELLYDEEKKLFEIFPEKKEAFLGVRFSAQHFLTDIFSNINAVSQIYVTSGEFFR